MKTAIRAVSAALIAIGIVLAGGSIASASCHSATHRHDHATVRRRTTLALHGHASANAHGHESTSNGSSEQSSASAQASEQGSASSRSSEHSSAPPGNNGTIKVDQVATTSESGAAHANFPHVSCTFALSFWGYDSGTDTAQVQFTAQPPSGSFTSVAAASGSTNFSFSVAQRMGGGQLDASQTYQLNVSGLSEQAQQGYHIKVMAEVSGSRGAAEKYKVFWYKPCSTASTSSSTTESSGASQKATGHAAGHVSASSSKAARSHHALTAKSEESQHVVTAKSEESQHFQTAESGQSSAAVALQGHSSVSLAQQGQALSSSGLQAGSSGLASSGSLPTGAGTDLGRFSPAKSALPAGALWTLVAGAAATLAGLGLLLAGRMLRRRNS